MAESEVKPHLITDKKAVLNWKTNLDLHTLLVMKTHGLSKGQALVQVYAEGVEGLSKRLIR